MKTKINLKPFSRRIGLGLVLLFVLYSCKKERIPGNSELVNKIEVSEAVKLQTSFAKVLAKALKKDRDLRSFIKSESLKQFDNDYDVLYLQVKNVQISNGESFYDKLLKFSTKQELDMIETKMPLLTVFVPTLPNFNPEIWNVDNETPMVAVTNDHAINTVSLYNELGDSLILKGNQIPGFPVLVIKENERVVVNHPTNNKVSVVKSTENTVLKSLNNISFSFVDEAFNGSPINKGSISTGMSKKNRLAMTGSISRIAPSPNLLDPNAIDQVNVDAYNSNNEWHRDFVYYGLTSSTPRGKFKNNYSEFITSFKFLTPDALGLISDQDEDPKVNPFYYDSRWSGNVPRTMWTEGSFEIKITVLINAKNGLGNELTKIMSVRPSELFDLQYEEQKHPFTPWKPTGIFVLKNIICKEYHPNIELIPWDLENYGTGWKFIFYEMDNAQEVTNNYENSTTFAANFGFDAGFGETVKIGLKFGASLTTSEKRTFSVKTTLNSDFLGEATLTFDQPIITGISNGSYVTREITTGNLLSISVEPRKVF